MTKRYHYSLYTDKALIEKARYIANYNSRSLNKHIEQVLLHFVNSFEKKHGAIEASKENDDSDDDETRLLIQARDKAAPKGRLYTAKNNAKSKKMKQHINSAQQNGG